MYQLSVVTTQTTVCAASVREAMVWIAQQLGPVPESRSSAGDPFHVCLGKGVGTDKTTHGQLDRLHVPPACMCSCPGINPIPSWYHRSCFVFLSLEGFVHARQMLCQFALLLNSVP